MAVVGGLDSEGGSFIHPLIHSFNSVEQYQINQKTYLVMENGKLFTITAHRMGTIATASQQQSIILQMPCIVNSKWLQEVGRFNKAHTRRRWNDESQARFSCCEEIAKCTYPIQYASKLNTHSLPDSHHHHSSSRFFYVYTSFLNFFNHFIIFIQSARLSQQFYILLQLLKGCW